MAGTNTVAGRRGRDLYCATEAMAPFFRGI